MALIQNVELAGQGTSQHFGMRGCCLGVIAVIYPLELGDFIQIQLHHNREEHINVVLVGSLDCPDVLVAEIKELVYFSAVVGLQR